MLASPPGASRYCPAPDTYRIGSCGGAPALPNSPVGQQLAWLLPYLAGTAGVLLPQEAAAHADPQALLPYLPPEQLAAAVNGTRTEQGPLRFLGFGYPPRDMEAVAIVQAATGSRAAVALGVGRTGLVDRIALSSAPPTLVPRNRFSGWFDVGGQRLFLRCTGSGSPTVGSTSPDHPGRRP